MNFHLRKHKKRILSAVLCGSMMLSTGAQTLAFDSETIFSSLFDGAQSSATDLSDSGYALQRLGLVAGGEDGDLMLDKIGSRSEGGRIAHPRGDCEVLLNTDSGQKRAINTKRRR